MAERQSRNILDRTGCQYLPYSIREFQHDRHSVPENASLELSLVSERISFSTTFDVCLAFTDVDNKWWIGNFPAWVSLNSRRPAARPQVGAPLASDVRQAAQHGIIALAVELQVPFLPDADADHASFRDRRIRAVGHIGFAFSFRLRPCKIHEIFRASASR